MNIPTNAVSPKDNTRDMSLQVLHNMKTLIMCKKLQIKPQLVLAKGFSDDIDVSEHKYAVLERQPLTLDQRQASLPQGEGEGHHYDALPREDENSLRPHPSDKQHYDDDSPNHEYAILEKL